jgi:hypothetical protein
MFSAIQRSPAQLLVDSQRLVVESHPAGLLMFSGKSSKAFMIITL